MKPTNNNDISLIKDEDASFDFLNNKKINENSIETIGNLAEGGS